MMLLSMIVIENKVPRNPAGKSAELKPRLQRLSIMLQQAKDAETEYTSLRFEGPMHMQEDVTFEEEAKFDRLNWSRRSQGRSHVRE
jgi:hypothetical protein